MLLFNRRWQSVFILYLYLVFLLLSLLLPYFYSCTHKTHAHRETLVILHVFFLIPKLLVRLHFPMNWLLLLLPYTMFLAWHTTRNLIFGNPLLIQTRKHDFFNNGWNVQKCSTISACSSRICYVWYLKSCTIPRKKESREKNRLTHNS